MLIRAMDVFDEQTLELTLKASNEGIWDWVRDLDDIYYSGRTLACFGHESSPPNIISNPEKLVHPEDLEGVREHIHHIIDGNSEDQLKIECKIVRPDGETRWILMRGIVTKEHGITTRMVGSIIDISSRRRAQEMIAEEKHMRRLIMDNIPLQIYFKDKESRYTLVNQRQIEWLGKKEKSEVLKKPSKEFFSPNSWRTQRKEELEIMLTGEPVINAVQREQWPDREDTFIKKVKRPWYDSTNELLGTYGISCDVTDLIKTKKELEKLALELQQQNKNHQEELSLAKEIQHAILPHNSANWQQLQSQWEGRVDIQTLYQPAAELTGDFYDIIPLEENKLGVLMIDVTGQGVRSAMIISLIKGLMEHAHHLAEKPAAYLDEINNGLATILQKVSIKVCASASYTLIDFNCKQVIVASAGHGFPLIQFRPDSKAEIKLTDTQRYESRRTIAAELGQSTVTKYSEQLYSLDEISSILLYTDGIYETSIKDGQIWGVNSLKEAYTTAKSQSEISTLQSFFNTISGSSDGHHVHNDICLVHLELNSGSDSLLK